METVSLAEVKAKFSQYVDQVEKQQDRIVVTRNGRPAAVLISPDDLEGLEETLAIMSDKNLAEKVREGLKDLEEGNTFSSEETKDRFLKKSVQ